MFKSRFTYLLLPALALSCGIVPTAPAATAAAAPAEAPSMTRAEAAKAVRRPVYELVDAKDEDGKDIKVSQIKSYLAVKEAEVLDFKDYGTHVVVVTEDGQKFSSRDTPAKAK